MFIFTSKTDGHQFLKNDIELIDNLDANRKFQIA